MCLSTCWHVLESMLAWTHVRGAREYMCVEQTMGAAACVGRACVGRARVARVARVAGVAPACALRLI